MMNISVLLSRQCWINLATVEIIRSVTDSRWGNIFGVIFATGFYRVGGSMEFIVCVFLRVVSENQIRSGHLEILFVSFKLVPIGFMPSISRLDPQFLRQSGARVSVEIRNCRR